MNLSTVVVILFAQVSSSAACSGIVTSRPPLGETGAEISTRARFDTGDGERPVEGCPGPRAAVAVGRGVDPVDGDAVAGDPHGVGCPHCMGELSATAGCDAEPIAVSVCKQSEPMAEGGSVKMSLASAPCGVNAG